MDGIADVNRGGRRQVVADIDEVPARDDEEAVRTDLHVRHTVQLWRGHGGVVKVVVLKNCLDGGDVVARGSGSGEEENVMASDAPGAGAEWDRDEKRG